MDGMLKIGGTDLNMMAEIVVPCDCPAGFSTTAEEAALRTAIETLRPAGRSR
jgi:hypothetical protein